MNANGLRIVFQLSCLALASFASFATGAFAQIYHVKEMNTEQIRGLDRQKTVVILPGGILEQHGPYLPSFTDGYMNERLTQDIANAIVERPGWKVLIFPIIPLGADGAHVIGEKYHFPGSFAVRPPCGLFSWISRPNWASKASVGSLSFTCTEERLTIRLLTRPANTSKIPKKGTWST